MTRLLWLLVVAVVLGSAAFLVGSRVQHVGCETQPPQLDTLEWLRREFSLDQNEFDQVKSLHDAYKPACEDLCRRIAANRRRLNGLADAAKAYSPEVDAALSEATALRLESQRLYLRHVDGVAAAMGPAEAQRYVTMMKKRIFGDCGCRGGMCLH